MPNSSLVRLVGWLRELGGSRHADSDAELLRVYAGRRDELAFAELLRRHGPLVWAVCRRSLEREQDAEDAFQTTFLVLARKADTIRKGGSLASWLIGVARRTANEVRVRADRPVPELPPRPAPGPDEAAASAEACDVILDEVRRLPDKYRLPLLLCGLEGLTKAEAARRLGWKEGTVSGRLARARARLQQRLVRRGLMTASVAALAAAMPPGLTARTLPAALRFAGEMLPARTTPEFLAQEILHMMTARWLPRLSIVVIGAVLIASAAGLAYHMTHHGVLVDETQASEQPPRPLPGQPHWQERLHLLGHAGGYTGFSPDGRTLTTFDTKDILSILDTATWKERARYDMGAHYGSHYTSYTVFSPDSRRFAVMGGVPETKGSSKRRPETTVIDASTGKELYRVPGRGPVFSPAGKVLATVLTDAVMLWDAATGKELHRLAADGKLPGYHTEPARFSPDGRRLFVPTKSGHGKLWDIATGKAIASPPGFYPAWSRDSRVFATVSPGPVVHLCDTETGAERATLQGFSEPGCRVQFAPDSRSFVTNLSEFGLLADGSPESMSPAALRRLPRQARRKVIDIRLWDAATGKELQRLPGQTQFCRDATFSPDSRAVLYQRLTDRPGYKMEAVVWDIAAAKERCIIRDPAGVDMVGFTPGGSAVMGKIGNRPTDLLRFWDAATGRLLPGLPMTVNSTFRLHFSPDGKILAVSAAVPGGQVGAPVLLDLHIFQWSAEKVVDETRGQPAPPVETPAKPVPPKSAAAQALEAIQKQVQQADADFSRQFAAATEAAKEDLTRKRSAALARFVAQARALARVHSHDPAAGEALELALRLSAGSETGPLGEQATQTLALIRRQFLNTPVMQRLVPWLTYHDSAEGESLLQTVLDSHPLRKVRGRAGYWLARTLHERAETALLLRQVPDLLNDPAVKQKQETIRFLQATDPAATMRRAEKLYERLRKDYADVKLYDFKADTLGPATERALFALRNLVVGRTAPEIEGKDLDGRPLKLSAYRGKVVVLIFCGDWCGPCRQMNPYKQELVKRHAQEPFVLLEINSDQDPDEWKAIMKEKGYTWRCWAESGTEGPIARHWNVRRWPTIYVLDPRGVIRYKDLRDEYLGKAVDELLRQMKQ